MGDMADDFLNDVIDAENERFDYLMGNISKFEAIERGILDEDGSLPLPYNDISFNEALGMGLLDDFPFDG